jgi:Homeodomain-like domain
MGKRSQAEVQKLAKQALKLLADGHKQSEVAQKLNVSLRTLQRWLASEKLPKADDSTLEIPKLCPEVVETSTNISMGIRNSFLNEIDNILVEHRNCNREIWQALKQKFDDEINQPDSSVRTINILSLAIDRHMQGEFRSACQGKQDLMTFQQAFKLLDALGFSVIPQSRTSELSINPEN